MFLFWYFVASLDQNNTLILFYPPRAKSRQKCVIHGVKKTNVQCGIIVQAQNSFVRMHCFQYSIFKGRPQHRNFAITRVLQ